MIHIYHACKFVILSHQVVFMIHISCLQIYFMPPIFLWCSNFIVYMSFLWMWNLMTSVLARHDVHCIYMNHSMNAVIPSHQNICFLLLMIVKMLFMMRVYNHKLCLWMWLGIKPKYLHDGGVRDVYMYLSHAYENNIYASRLCDYMMVVFMMCVYVCICMYCIWHLCCLSYMMVLML